MRKVIFNNWSFLTLLLAATFLIASCGDDTPEEMMEELDREKFIGTYLGSLACPETLMFLSGEDVQFTIAAGVDPDATSTVTVTLPVEGTPGLSLDATVSGNNLTVDSNLEGVPVDILGTSILVNIDATGTFVYNDSDNSLAGNIALDVKSQATGGTVGTDDCQITGVKQ